MTTLTASFIIPVSSPRVVGQNGATEVARMENGSRTVRVKGGVLLTDPLYLLQIAKQVVKIHDLMRVEQREVGTCRTFSCVLGGG